MAFVFAMTFSFIGGFLSDLMAKGVDYIISLIDVALTKAQINEVVHSLVIDGVCNGVGSDFKLSSGNSYIIFLPVNT